MQLEYFCNFVQNLKKLGNIKEQISWELLKQFLIILACEIVYIKAENI